MFISFFSRINIVIIVSSAFIAGSCNNTPAGISFPYKKEGYGKPVSQPLQFSAPKKLIWDTVRTGGIHPVKKKLDIDALPSKPFAASGFNPFRKPPEVAHFNFNSLPQTTLSLEKIPAQSIRFKTSILPPPVIVKAGVVVPKTGTTLAVNDIGMAQGFPDKNADCLLKDKFGFIWIGTNNAIYRYTGEYMEKFGSVTDGAFNLLEDKKGRIWYINQNSIGMIDPMKGTISTSTAIHTMNPQLPRMIEDENGFIWAASIHTKGVDIIDPENFTYKQIDRSSGLSGSFAWGIYKDAKKNLWITTNEGADIINPERNTIRYLKKLNGLGNDTLQAITGNDRGRVWIAFKHGGVNSIDIQQGVIADYGNLQGLNNTATYSLFNDHKGRVWIGSSAGLYLLDPEKNKLKYFTEKEGLPVQWILGLLQDDQNSVWVASYFGGLCIVEQDGDVVHPVGTESISTLLEDSRGRIWVGAGTSSGGITILDKEKKQALELKKEEGLSDNWIQTMLEMDGNIWLTTGGGGFDILDLNHKTISITGKKEGLASDSLYSVVRDSHSNSWLTGPSLGVDMIDSAKNLILHAGVKQGLSAENIVDMKSDLQGKIWLATYTKGVDVIDLQKGTIQNLRQGPGLKDTCYRILLPDASGRMWIGTDKGIYIADPLKGIITNITTKEGLCNNYITSMVMYQGKVLAGTKNKVSIITPPSGNNNLNGKEKPDTVWKVALLAGSEGLVAVNNNWSTNIATREGEYLWGDNGITIINQIKAQKDTTPPTYVTALTVMNEPQHFDMAVPIEGNDTVWNGDTYYLKGQMLSDLSYAGQHRFTWDGISGPYYMPVNLSIPHDQNYLQFQFGQLNLLSKEPTIYSYALEGIDKNWSQPSDKTTTENYLNLPPGNYIFRVRSKNISGHWGDPAVFSFTIMPPWYQTWWAYTIIVLIGASLLRGYIVYRSRQLQKENRILEEKVTQRTEQLKKSLEDLKATQSQLIQSEKMASLGELTAGIAHEIQNPLNFVNNFSEINGELIDEMQQELRSGKTTEAIDISNNIKENQEKINFHGKRADAIVKSMLQHSRSSSGKKEPVDINALCDEYLRLSYHGLRAKDKSFNSKFETTFDPAVGSVVVVAQDIGRVLLNLINNAFFAVNEKKKMNINGYEPTVAVSTNRIKGKIEIRVSDNGNGIPAAARDKIFQPFFTTKPAGQGTGLGLSLSYDIVKVHGGEIKVETKEGEGTEFVIQLPVV